MRLIWNDFWFREVPPHSLAAFRILFGIYFLLYFLRFAPHVELLFSNRGVYAPFLIPDLGLPVFWAYALYATTIAVILAFTAGWKTRFTTPLLLLLFLYYFFLNFAANNSAFDRLNIIILAILCFARLDAVWALKTGSHNSSRNYANEKGERDRRGHTSRRPADWPDGSERFDRKSSSSALDDLDHNTGRDAQGFETNCMFTAKDNEPLVCVWPVRLMTLQIVLLYCGSGLWKLINPYWHTGEMMKWTLVGPWASDLSFRLARLGLPDRFYDLLVWSIIGFELTMPFALFSRKLRKFAVVIGFFFHWSIALLLNIPEFMNCVCAYALFVKPETIRKNLQRILTALRWSVFSNSS